MRQVLAIVAACGFVAFAALAPPDTLAFRRDDFDQRYFVDPGFIVKDHALIQAAGDTFHLFYTKGDQSLPESETAKSLGHATSLDLRRWKEHPDVIFTVPGTWEEHFIWAPHIVQPTFAEGTPPQYYMFYTGLNLAHAQAIGVAISNDLYHWTKSPLNPVYTPDTTWAEWHPDSYSNCRDPYVFRDGGVWHLLTTTWTRNLEGAISHATSANLFDWTDRGPLMVHAGPNPWRVFESVQLHSVNGGYHLFFNEQNVQSTSYLSAPTLEGPWNSAAKQFFDPGRAVEIAFLDSTWILSRHTAISYLGQPFYMLKLDNLSWPTNAKPTIAVTAPIPGWVRVSGTAFAFQPVFWDNPLVRGDSAVNFEGNSWIGTLERYQGPLQNGVPGGIGGDVLVGVLQTPPFQLEGNRIEFRIAGTPDSAQVFLGLYTEADSILQISSTGPPDSSDVLAVQTWDVTPWMGQSVYLAIVDTSTTGHISIDALREYFQPDVTDAPPGALPSAVAILRGNWPNPFNPRTTIAFDLERAGRVRLGIFDVRGRRLQQLVDAPMSAGSHRVEWDGRLEHGGAAASGTYWVRLDLDGKPVGSAPATLVK